MPSRAGKRSKALASLRRASWVASVGSAAFAFACGTDGTGDVPARGGGAGATGASGAASGRSGSSGTSSSAGSGAAGAGGRGSAGSGVTASGGRAQAGSDASGGAETGGTTSGAAGTPPEPEGGAGSSSGGPPGVRGVTNPEVAFDGTETDLARQYNHYHQTDGTVEFVDDPVGGTRRVLRFVRPKSADWTHEMVRLLDKRSDYRDAAQVTEWETAYHYKQEMYLPNDPQYSRDFVNLLEDFHCEPCEANNLQLYTSYVEPDSVCLWVTYSTDPEFDPRGPDRGGTTDPWDSLRDENRLELWLAADGTPTLPATMPETAALLLCRDDVRVSDLFERWVNVEFLVKVSSYDTGVIRVWIDGKPFFYDGPNGYRFNQDGDGRNDALPVNVFQWGLYMQAFDVMDGTPDDWVLYATPPLLELGDDVIYTP